MDTCYSFHSSIQAMERDRGPGVSSDIKARCQTQGRALLQCRSHHPIGIDCLLACPRCRGLLAQHHTFVPEMIGASRLSGTPIVASRTPSAHVQAFAPAHGRPGARARGAPAPAALAPHRPHGAAPADPARARRAAAAGRMAAGRAQLRVVNEAGGDKLTVAITGEWSAAL